AILPRRREPKEPPVKKLACCTLTILALGLAALPRAAAAAPYIVSLNLLGGTGGSLDGEPASGYANRSLDLGISLPTDVNTLGAVSPGGEPRAQRRRVPVGRAGELLDHLAAHDDVRLRQLPRAVAVRDVPLRIEQHVLIVALEERAHTLGSVGDGHADDGEPAA